MKSVDTNKAAIAHNMKLIRSLTGLSMHEFGMRLGSISKDQIASYESQRAVPPRPTMITVCELAGIEENDLRTKMITNEEIVKDMFTAISNGGSKARSKEPNLTQTQIETLEGLKERIANLECHINAQNDIIQIQKDLLNNFSSFIKK